MVHPCMWFKEEPSQFSIGETAQSLTCPIMENPHTGVDECPRILLSCFRSRNSGGALFHAVAAACPNLVKVTSDLSSRAVRQRERPADQCVKSVEGGGGKWKVVFYPITIWAGLFNFLTGSNFQVFFNIYIMFWKVRRQGFDEA